MSDSSKLRPGTVAVMFLQQFLQDRDAGTVRTLAEYQAMFSDDPDAVAEEYAELTASDDATAPNSDRYRDAELLARGGMGTVFRAVDPRLGRTIAIKHLGSARDDTPKGASPLTDAQLAARFTNEARITAQLQHPNIVPVFDVGDDGPGRPFFTMPLIEGRSLSDILTATQRGSDKWPLARTIGILVRVCDAVAYAHSRGIVHRDLKPANVMVGKFGEAYVVDWGLARAEDSQDDASTGAGEAITASPLHTRTGDIIGTPAYIAPEQASGDVPRGNKRTDVYSLGATLYHVLAGNPPYLGEEEHGGQTTIDRVKTGPPRSLHSLAKDCPPPLVAICERAMARDPNDRYPSAIELAEDLSAFLEDRVVKAHATGPIAELRTWMRRNRGMAVASLLAIVALTAGIISSTMLKARSDHNATVAEENFELAFEVAEGLIVEFGLYALENEPGADPMRIAMANKALDYYERFAALRSDDPRVVDKVALSQLRVATLRAKLGHTEAAIAALAKAHRSYDELRQGDRLQDSHRIAMLQLDVESLLIEMERGKLDDVMTRLPDLIAEADTLLERNPQETGLRHVHASALHNLAMAHVARKEYETAAALCDRKIAATKAFVDARPDLARAHEQHASGLVQRGVIAGKLERPGDAEKMFRQATEHLETALQKFPRHRQLLARLSEAYNQLGVVLRALQRPDDSIAALLKAIDGQRQLAAAHPNVRDYNGQLAGAQCNLAIMLARGGDQKRPRALLEEATTYIRRALTIDPDYKAFRNYRRIIARELANVLLALEDHAAAATSIREFVEEQPDAHDWQAGYQLAACATVCQRAPSIADGDRARFMKIYGDEAMQHLLAAERAGQIDAAALQSAAFDAIRSRPEFVALRERSRN